MSFIEYVKTIRDQRFFFFFFLVGEFLNDLSRITAHHQSPSISLQPRTLVI